MTVQILKGSKQEIAEGVARISGDVCEAIVFIEDPKAPSSDRIEDVFSEMTPFVVHVGSVDYSRETLYNRVEGE